MLLFSARFGNATNFIMFNYDSLSGPCSSLRELTYIIKNNILIMLLRI